MATATSASAASTPVTVGSQCEFPSSSTGRRRKRSSRWSGRKSLDGRCATPPCAVRRSMLRRKTYENPLGVCVSPLRSLGGQLLRRPAGEAFLFEKPMLDLPHVKSADASGSETPSPAGFDLRKEA